MTQPIDKWQEMIDVLGRDAKRKYPRRELKCPKCGRGWQAVTFYSCPKTDCPTKTKVTC